MKPEKFKWLAIALVVGVVIGIVPRVDAGRIGGPLSVTGAVGPYQSAAVAVPFAGGDVAVVMMVGGDSTQLELCLFDGNWNVSIGSGNGNNQVAQMIVLRGGVFHVVVRNLGPFPNAFFLRTN